MTSFWPNSWFVCISNFRLRNGATGLLFLPFWAKHNYNLYAYFRVTLNNVNVINYGYKSKRLVQSEYYARNKSSKLFNVVVALCIIYHQQGLSRFCQMTNLSYTFSIYWWRYTKQHSRRTNYTLTRMVPTTYWPLWKHFSSMLAWT